jgi:hypothetical protein
MWAPAVEKGPAARRRPKTARETYSLYVERAVEGAALPQMGPLSAAGYSIGTKMQWRSLPSRALDR